MQLLRPGQASVQGPMPSKRQNVQQMSKAKPFWLGLSIGSRQQCNGYKCQEPQTEPRWVSYNGHQKTIRNIAKQQEQQMVDAEEYSEFLRYKKS